MACNPDNRWHRSDAVAPMTVVCRHRSSWTSVFGGNAARGLDLAAPSLDTQITS